MKAIHHEAASGERVAVAVLERGDAVGVKDGVEPTKLPIRRRVLNCGLPQRHRALVNHGICADATTVVYFFAATDDSDDSVPARLGDLHQHRPDTTACGVNEDRRRRRQICLLECIPCSSESRDPASIVSLRKRRVFARLEQLHARNGDLEFVACQRLQ